MAHHTGNRKSGRPHKLTQHELSGGPPPSHSHRHAPNEDARRNRKQTKTTPGAVPANGAQPRVEEMEDEDETEDEDPPGHDGRAVADEDVGDGITDICAICPGRRCVCHLRGRSTAAQRGRGSLPGPVRLRLSRRSAKTYGASVKAQKKESSLSSLSPLDGDDASTVALGENGADQEDQARWDGSDADDLSSSLDYGSDTSAEPPHVEEVFRATVPKTDDEGADSEVGDVYLEYTDFGANGAGRVITWSEAEYDESEADDEAEKEEEKEIEHQGEFAELLMDVDDSDLDLGDIGEDSPFYLNRLDSIARQGSEHPSDGDTDDQVRFLGLGAGSGSEDEALYIIEEVSSSDEDGSGSGAGEEDSLSASDDGGATTDSLDEDDHSGLVRFGIETDDPEDKFWDVPEDSRLAAVLKDLEASGSVQFCVLDENSSKSVSAPPTTPRPASSSIPKLPVMGGFDAQQSVVLGTESTLVDNRGGTPGSNGFVRTRTIIADGPLGGNGDPAPSPFSGGKVIRYNHFRKLRERQMRKLLLAADPGGSGANMEAPTTESVSGTSARPTPQIGGMLELPGTAEEEDGEDEDDEFDITAFIRGISSKEGSDTEDEALANRGAFANEDPLAPLSRWNRVPMSAFRRSRTTGLDGGWADDVALDGAFRRPATLSSPGVMKKQRDHDKAKKRRAATMIASPMLGPWSSPSRSAGSVAVGPGLAPSRKARRAIKKAQKQRSSSTALPSTNGVSSIATSELPMSGQSLTVGGGIATNGITTSPSLLTSQAPPTEGLLPATSVNTPFFSGVLGGSGEADVPMLNLDDASSAI